MDLLSSAHRAVFREHRTLCLLFLMGASTGALSAQTPEWSVDPTWAVSVGEGSDEGHQLLGVLDAVLLKDGRLVVLSAATQDIRVFSPDGTFIRTVGRDGQGPGEFQLPFGFRLRPSGHLLVYDRANLRVTEFDTDWEVVGTQRVGYDRFGMSATWRLQRPMANGMIPVAAYDTPTREAVQRQEGVYEEDLVIRLFEGSDVRASIRRPRGKVYTARSGNMRMTRPFPMGEFVLFNWGSEHVVLGSSHSTAFDLFDSTGALVRTVHGEGDLRPATRHDIAAFDERMRPEPSDSMVIQGMGPGCDVCKERFLDDAPRGDQFPLFDQVELDDEGLVWAREYLLASEIAVWQVIDPETGLIGRVSIPASWNLLRPSASRLIVVERDEYDVEMVRVYGVRH